MENKSEIPVVIVVGMGKDTHAIGMQNGLLWHVPDDMKRFKRLSMGHPVIMGRKTFESILDILGKPLPGRTNIVVTRNPDYKHEGAEVAGSLEEALEIAKSENPTEIHIGGGSEMYRQALPYTSKIFVTYFDDDKAGDTFFPEFKEAFVEIERHGGREFNGLKYEWVDYVRK